ncbi:MAG: S41 family peptidase, partial [Planctomycetia bacterium]|nr:S41 family peptidase [Planctomycetia bacterium]
KTVQKTAVKADPERSLKLSQKPVKAERNTRLLRYPDIWKDQIVFSYGGDLWKVSAKGGNAIRLTSHEGLELSPKFSPNGKWIAFTSQYDGDEQVFIIPSEGGMPRQLTWYPAPGPNPPRRGFEQQVLGWTPDSKNVLFRSGRESNSVDALTHLFKVNIDGGLPQRLPMPVAGMGDLSLDGQKIVYSPLFRDFRHWKRYEGGWAQYLMIYDIKEKSFRKVPTTPRTDRDPMWIQDDVWFVSDRDGTMNLYRYDTARKNIEQKTKYNDWDVRWASSDGEKQIVYELGGRIHLYDTAAKTDRLVPIHVPHEGLAARPSRINAAQNIEEIELGPKGKRALFVARGDLFTVPAEKGNTRNLTNTSGAHDRGAVWSPNGRWIAFISDQSGEDQIYVIDQTGKQKPVQLTQSMNRKLNHLQWSPDNKALSFWDAKNHLRVLELSDPKEGEMPKAGKLTEVAWAKEETPFHFSWSPDGKYLAYVLNTDVDFSVISIWDRETGKSYRITDPQFDNFSPAWDPNGDWLYFIGRREFYPQISLIEWNYAGDRMNALFAVALRKDVKNRFAPESDEVEPDLKKENAEKTPDSKDKATKKSESKKKKSKNVQKEESKKPESKKIDFAGIGDRIIRLPGPAENYEGLSAAGDFLFYVKESAPFYGRESGSRPALMSFDLKNKKANVFLDNIGGYVISPDGSKILIKQGPLFKMYDVGPKAGGEPKVFSTANLYADRVPNEEWNEIFNEVWRRFRDYFYVSNMHGCDWEQIGNQYRTLLPYVAHRSDLTYILTEMISELNIGHTYVEGGDFIIPKRPQSGLPGAVFVLDPKANLYKIAKIYKGQNEEGKYISPLTEVGVDAKVGDYVFEIDGEVLKGSDNPYRLLRNKSGTVSWKVGRKADGSDARIITYKPIANEANLRYLNFVLDRMKRAEKLSNGRIGYIHIPNMGGDGGYEFLKWYYPQIRKEGIIIDDRNNGGGNISSWILMRLHEKVLGTRFGSTRISPEFYPPLANNAHFVCLINETSASDGDIFPYYFKKSNLGPVIGKRSWGGVVGITGTGPLIDGGIVYVPLSATNDESGKYIIEGHGVDPDIVVDQDPVQMLKGKDPQFERGIKELLKKMDKEPRIVPKRPADPNRSKKAVPKYVK